MVGAEYLFAVFEGILKGDVIEVAVEVLTGELVVGKVEILFLVGDYRMVQVEGKVDRSIIGGHDGVEIAGRRAKGKGLYLILAGDISLDTEEIEADGAAED